MLNQARYSSSSPVPPPSSPPFASALPLDHSADSFPDSRDVPSPAQTLWTAHPSPTQTLGYSSPELPSFSALRGLPRTPSTVARHERTDSTSYFTASWGSPYRHPPPAFNPQRNQSVDIGSDDIDASGLEFGLEHLLPRPLEEDDSPGRFNLEHLIPQRVETDQSPNQFNLEHLIPSRLTSSLVTPTRLHFRSESRAAAPHNPTEAWVQQFLDGRWNREENNWLSDHSAGSEVEIELGRQLEVPWEGKAKKGHKSNKTLNQQDFWSHFSDGEKEELGKMMASRYAPDAHSREASSGSLKSPIGRGGHAEKAPTPSPKLSETTEHAEPSEPTPSKPQPVVEPAFTPRPRKKVLVKGKGCIISIPRDIPRGTPGYPPKPMSPAEVQSRMQRFERDGDSVQGGQNRAIWPDDDEIRADRARGHRVRVPNKADWDAYVNHLVEAKLAALGVSLGGEEEESPMSRQPSVQHPGLPFSPPLPTSSAGSHRMNRHGSIVSTHFPHGPSPGHPGHQSRQSMASPMSGFGNPRTSMHMHRHSTFASPASFAHHAASPSGAWSPGNYFGPQGARGGSPALSMSRPDLADVISPISPYGMRPNQQFPLTPTHKDELLHVQQQQQQQLLQAHLQHQQQLQQQQLLGLRPSSTLAEVPEDEAEDEVPAMKHAAQPGPEIAIPTPRGHRHNISANLEREARDAEYHLEEAIDKQFDEGGDFSTEPEITPQQLKPSNAITNSTWEDSRPVLHQPQPHNRAHSLAKPQQSLAYGFGAQQDNPPGDSDGARTNISDATNPSLEDEHRGTANSSAHHSKAASQVSNSWREPNLAFGKTGSATHSKHTSRSSISKLNVEAKEFKFNPSASFNPGSSAGSGSSFSPAIKSGDFVPAPQSNLPAFGGLSNPNVSAPAFKPDAPIFKPDAPTFKPLAATFRPPIPTFEPLVVGNPAMPTSGFNFFSTGPNFKPDAPAFNPGTSEFRPLMSSPPPAPAPASVSSKIFGDVNISASDIIKPAKRSKAIPIQPPSLARQTPEKEEEDHEDEEGRITQADGREKRARRGPADGDDVPRFALQPVLQPQQRAQAVEQDSQDRDEALPEDNENLSPNVERAPSKSSPEPLSLQHDNSAIEDSMPTGKSTETIIEDRTPPESDAEESDGHTPTVEEAPRPFSKKHKSSLSATAKPFEFNPGASYDFGIHVTKPSVAQSESLDQTHISPEPYDSRSPATTFRPSDDGSYKTAYEGRRHAPYPESESADFDQLGQVSFNDIDAVMKHMNEEGSDFGVERDEPNWEQSSARLSTHNFDRTDLPPNTNMRSDAPSPSPRRLYAPRNMGASSTSITHDPFDDERAGLAYESPIHRLNNADEVSMSNWDEGLLSEGEDKIQTRSRFFDSHVDDLIGGLLQSRLGPLESNLQAIQDSLALISHKPVRGRRSLSTNGNLDSDADDEDDETDPVSHYRNRSPRKDRKMEKIRTIIKEALESQQPPESVLPEKIRDIVIEALVANPVAPSQYVPENIRDVIMDALAQSQPKFEPVPADQIKAIVEEAVVSHQPAAPIVETIKPEEVRSIITEVVASHAPQISEPIHPAEIRSIVMDAIEQAAPLQVNMSEIYEVVGSLKASIAQTTHLQSEDVRELIDDAFKRQSMEVAKREESQAIQDRDTRIAELEAALKDTALRLAGEADARQALELCETDSSRLLKVTEQELALLKEAHSDDQHTIRALKEESEIIRHSLETFRSNDEELRNQLAALQDENDALKLKAIAFESSEEDMKQKLDSVTAENEALSFTLEEHRLSANKWRNDVQLAHQETESMRKAIGESRFQAEEAARIRESMRAKFETLQHAMVAASEQAAAERSQWQRSDEEHLKKYEVLSARIEAEARTRERLERELERLETQEREGMKLRITLEQAQKHSARLEETIDQLKQETVEHQKTAERFERQFREAREAGHTEIRRTRVLMEADIEAANNQVNIVRAELEAEVARVQAELDSVRMDADTTKAKHELDLEAASDAKNTALAEAFQGRQQALQEQQQSFERRLAEVSKEHARALEIAREDRDRKEAYHEDRLSIADSKMDLLQEKISLLEERLSIAKEAANAAAAAAQSIKSADTGLPEKVSPQALRESISVLQDQLQERESRIESLEHQLAELDTDAPNKLKERDTEISWLRELLGVRIDDLSDLINALAQPSFDRETVRDAAIRIRTNLQMEQQEKERLVSGDKPFPTLATLSNFASPKAAHLAAAFGNWRKGRETTSSALAGGSGSSSRSQTPSRTAPHSAQSFLSGLMTPPTSNLRRTPDLPSSSTRSHSASSRGSNAGFPSLGKQPMPSTPPLLRKASYDQDAEDGHFSESGFYDDESTVDGDVTPIGATFGHELRR